MKASSKLKILGFCMVAVGATLIALACTIWSYHPHGDPFFGKMPQLGALIPGALLCFLSIPMFVMGFSPNLTKFGARLRTETLDHAGADLTEATAKTADVITPAITKTARAVKRGLSDNSESKYCKHCGGLIDEDSRFCKHCSQQ